MEKVQYLHIGYRELFRLQMRKAIPIDIYKTVLKKANENGAKINSKELHDLINELHPQHIIMLDK